jgi:hypothetical protein
MQIARPPDGFHIIERPAVTKLIAAYRERWPRLDVHWEGIKLRLKFTGHREGILVGANRPGYRLFADDGDTSAGLPRIKTVYLPLGDPHHRNGGNRLILARCRALPVAFAVLRLRFLRSRSFHSFVDSPSKLS